MPAAQGAQGSAGVWRSLRQPWTLPRDLSLSSGSKVCEADTAVFPLSAKNSAKVSPTLTLLVKEGKQARAHRAPSDGSFK